MPPWACRSIVTARTGRLGVSHDDISIKSLWLELDQRAHAGPARLYFWGLSVGGEFPSLFNLRMSPWRSIYVTFHLTKSPTLACIAENLRLLACSQKPAAVSWRTAGLIGGGGVGSDDGEREVRPSDVITESTDCFRRYRHRGGLVRHLIRWRIINSGSHGRLFAADLSRSSAQQVAPRNGFGR